MTVFVDDWRQQARVGRLQARWSHLFVGPHDELDELHAFAESIGLRRSWFQDKRWPHAHYDVTDSKREQAIAAGATPITWRETGQRVLNAIEERRTRQARPVTRIIAAGSPNWSDPGIIRTALTAAAERHPDKRLTLVHGMGDPRHPATGQRIRWAVAEHLSPGDQMQLHGTDWLADRIARQMGWEVKTHQAAGDARPHPGGRGQAAKTCNAEPADPGPVEVVAFIRDQFPGAIQAAEFAERQGIPVERHEVTTSEPPPVTPHDQPREEHRPAQVPAIAAHRDGTGWAEPVYVFRSSTRTCTDPHRGQGEWQASERAQDAGGGRCSDGHTLAAPLCEATAGRLAAAGIHPDDPALTFVRVWNTTAHTRQAERAAAQAGEHEPEAGA
jgi:Protein of unknown function (DUF4031)